MRISHLHLEKVGPFKKATFHFPPKKDPNGAEIHIFTGPNGCGKSTLLYALAGLCGETDGVQERSWFEQDSMVLGGNLGDGNPAISYLGFFDIEFRKSVIKSSKSSLKRTFFEEIEKRFWSFEKSELETLIQETPQGYFSNAHLSERVFRLISKKLDQTLPIEKKYKSATFAYSGARGVEQYNLRGIEELPDHALEKALQFQSVPQSRLLFQWIALTKSKAALEKENKNNKAAMRFSKSLGKLEQVLSKIVETPIKFNLNTSPFQLCINVDGQELGFNVLSDGLKSIIGWLGDLIMRLDRLEWDNDRDILSQNFLLLLDEIDIHLHPTWQRKVLPVVQELFPNAQVFCSTHSPMVVNSVDNAWIHSLEMENGLAHPKKPIESEEARSYAWVMSMIFDVKKRFGPEIEKKLDDFYNLRKRIRPNDFETLEQFLKLGRELAETSEEVRNIVLPEMRQLERSLERAAG